MSWLWDSIVALYEAIEGIWIAFAQMFLTAYFDVLEFAWSVYSELWDAFRDAYVEIWAWSANLILDGIVYLLELWYPWFQSVYDFAWAKSASAMPWFLDELDNRGALDAAQPMFDAWDTLQPFYAEADWLFPISESLTVYATGFTAAFGIRAYRWIKAHIPAMGD